MSARALVTKRCTRCDLEKSLDLFPLHAARKDGHASQCKRCNADRAKVFRDKHPDLIRDRNRAFRESNRVQVSRYFRRKYLERNYHLTIEQFEVLVAGQDGCCAICRGELDLTSNDRSVHIDHDHSCCAGSGSCGRCIRGVLCINCNQALGGFRDNEAVLVRAIEYLRSHRA